ncbi:MAG: hypothetical protein SCG72_00475, partial [Nitrosarchaeum sp.]|nr:hypothetical protein [Nitrosarchaeum sp.]
MSVLVFSYGYMVDVQAAGPDDCGADQVYQNNECVNALPPLKNDLSLQTDLPLYAQGGKVLISGTIHNYENLSPADVTILVLAPDNHIVTISQVAPDADGTFKTTVKTDGPQFKTPGIYSIRAQFSPLKSTITFEFTGGSG